MSLKPSAYFIESQVPRLLYCIEFLFDVKISGIIDYTY